MLEFAIIAVNDSTTESASFFGFLGVACALVFASNFKNFSSLKNNYLRIRSRCCLWNCKEWCWYLKHGCIKARAHH